MPKEREIRADFDRETIVVYQAYAPAIADAAMAAQRFVAPFSFQRMTWIKPSFFWLMERSNWGQKSGQERTLAVRIRRSGWKKGLSLGVLTGYELSIHSSAAAWRHDFDMAPVHIQWDPERSLRGESLPCYSIQVGLSRHVIHEYVEDWIVEIRDLSALVAKMNHLIRSGQGDKVKRLLPPERSYPLDREIGGRLYLDE